MTVNDSYGDGLQYGGVVGNYTLADDQGNVLVQMVDGGNFGSQANDPFCVEATGSDIPGCTDSTACNFDVDATTDDGSCTYGVEYYLDSDNDGHGGALMGTTCSTIAPAGSVFLAGDYNDANSTVYPGAPATATGIDNDCNGIVDPDEEATPTCLRT